MAALVVSSSVSTAGTGLPLALAEYSPPGPPLSVLEALFSSLPQWPVRRRRAGDSSSFSSAPPFLSISAPRYACVQSGAPCTHDTRLCQMWFDRTDSILQLLPGRAEAGAEKVSVQQTPFVSS